MLISKFTEISSRDVGVAGGKGASLGEMTRAGIPVPPGFIISADAFEAFLGQAGLAAEIGTLLDSADMNRLDSVERISNRIRALISEAETPHGISKAVLAAFRELGAGSVAVRSSATVEDSAAASWAGELETFLNVSEEDLAERVKDCWSSLYTPRAIGYRIEKGMRREKVSVAVVVQSMVQSEVSGTCFTVHPVSKEKNHMVIEAGYGLGEAIVSGSITPDTYVVDKTDFSLFDISVSKQDVMIMRGKNGCKSVSVPPSRADDQKLEGRDIVKLARLCSQVEKHYNSPCDIEWAFESGRPFILQSRPITTL